VDTAVAVAEAEVVATAATVVVEIAEDIAITMINASK
jgi:hypothetical protein